MNNIEIKELIRLRKFHMQEHKKFDSMLKSALNENKKNNPRNKENTITFKQARKAKDVNDVFYILSVAGREVGTGELCDLLNKRTEHNTMHPPYHSMTFTTNIGTMLKEDKRFSFRIGKVNGKRTTLWGLKKGISQLNSTQI